MDRLDMALDLIREAQIEKENLSKYAEEYAKLPDYKDPGYWDAVQRLDRKYKRIPKKSVVNDNLRIARRILLDEYM